MKKRIGKTILGFLGVTTIVVIGLTIWDIVSESSLLKELEEEDEYEEEETMDEDIITEEEQPAQKI